MAPAEILIKFPICEPVLKICRMYIYYYIITIENSFLPVESDTQGLEDGEEGCGGGSVGEPGARQVQVLQLYSNLKSIIQIFYLIT